MQQKGQLRILIVAALVLLLADGLLLVRFVLPLAESRRTDAAGSSAPVARLSSPGQLEPPILPTHDPTKPWPTRTPTPQPTPWLVITATRTRAPTSTPVPAETTSVPVASGLAQPANALPPQATRLRAGNTGAGARPPLIQTPQGDAGAGASAGDAQVDFTATPDALTAQALPVPTELPGATVDPTFTPAPTETGAVEATALLDETATPDADTPTPSAPFTPGDENGFTSYVRGQYGSLAGQALNIAQVTCGSPGSGIPEVTVEVNVDPQNNVFVAQQAALSDYGRRLLDDVKAFYEGQPSAVQVAGDFNVASPDDCDNNPDWCIKQGYDSDSGTWSVTWTYIIGTFDEGSSTVDVWSPAQ